MRCAQKGTIRREAQPKAVSESIELFARLERITLYRDFLPGTIPDPYKWNALKRNITVVAGNCSLNASTIRVKLNRTL